MPKQFEIWIADLNPQLGNEPGKKRSVLVIQTNLLNKIGSLPTEICNDVKENIKIILDLE